MTRFIEFVNGKFGKKFRTYDDLYQWSVAIPFLISGSHVGFCRGQSLKKVGSGGGRPEKVPGTKWFPGARLNFVEDLLRYGV